MDRPKVVFDTNVFLRALINPKGINARLVESLDRFILVVSPAIIEVEAGSPCHCRLEAYLARYRR